MLASLKGELTNFHTETLNEPRSKTAGEFSVIGVKYVSEPER